LLFSVDLFSIAPENILTILADGKELKTIPIDWEGFKAIDALVFQLEEGCHQLSFGCSKMPVQVPGD
jgi:hypothetical protein